jgi:predicted metal-dependent HD superfamily phosphohydrolase
MATIHAGGVIDPDQQLMCDIDLASLGTPDWNVMCANSRGIRKEYAHVPQDVYVQKRGEILGGFADRESLYYTPHFRGLYTERAKSNIRREIAILPELAKL